MILLKYQGVLWTGMFFLLILVSSNLSSAQDNPDRDRENSDQGASRAAELFQQMDRNSDGKLVKGELPLGLARRFDKVDADGDSSISKKEFAKLFRRPVEPTRPSDPGAVAPENLKEQFDRSDDNGDGKITADEAGGIIKSRLKELDTNSDGAVDLSEYQTGSNKGFFRQRGISPTVVEQLSKDYWPEKPRHELPIARDILQSEKVSGEGVWVDPAIGSPSKTMISITVWFDRQFLGDGDAFERRAAEFSGQRRQELVVRVVDTLKTLNEQSYRAAKESMRQLVKDKKIALVRWHWIVNGFSCVASAEGVNALKDVPGVKKIFANRQRIRAFRRDDREPTFFEHATDPAPEPQEFKHPWYTRYLLADRTWEKLNVSGAGTLNVVMDSNFLFSPNVTRNLYRNAGEIPGNGIDDDKNGLIDDYHGYNFVRNDAVLNARGEDEMHGFMCVNEICGNGTDDCPYEFGLAPSAQWAGVIGRQAPEQALEWAVEQGADTLSMSFSGPSLGELRSHWRKVMEHATFCGLCCVSGAGNFAREGSSSFAPVPVQMRIPEDIPAVFTAAGVRRSFQRTSFSSQGPVKWETEHYQQGLVDKPDFCAFNIRLPGLMPDGTALQHGASGNSFAGPMLAGTLALMLSADPDLLPWDARQILIETTSDVGPKEGFDHQTGHGLINCYRAVREVLRRKSVRDSADPTPYKGRQSGDVLDMQRLSRPIIIIERIQPDSPAETAGLQPGDVVESIDEAPIRTSAHLGAAIEKAKASNADEIVHGVRRDGKVLKLRVLLPKEGKMGIRFRERPVSDAPAFE